MANVTGVTKHFAVAKEGFTTTTSATIAPAATTVPLNSVTGYSNGDVVVLVIDGDDIAKKQVFTGTVDTTGVQITNVVWTEGSNTTHTAGASVVDYVAATHQGMTTKGLLVSHDQDGTLKSNVVETAKIKDANVTTNKLADGAVTPAKWTNPYKFSVYLPSNQALSSSTWTKAQLSSENFDSNSNFDSTTNYRYTVPVSGFYFINAQIGIGSSGTNAIANTGAIYKNGSGVVVGPSMVGNGTGNALPRIQINALLQLSAGDYIELWGYCGEGSRDIAGGSSVTYMTGYLVSQT